LSNSKLPPNDLNTETGHTFFRKQGFSTGITDFNGNLSTLAGRLAHNHMRQASPLKIHCGNSALAIRDPSGKAACTPALTVDSA